MKKILHGLKVFLFPCAENSYWPVFFRIKSIIGVFVVMSLLWGGYYVQTEFVFVKTDFLAAVLPGALTALVNQDRADNGIGMLTEDPILAKAAENKANDMAAKGYFSHVTPDGKTPWYWLDQVGYKYTYAGENLAVDFTDSKDVEDAWMRSPTHRANLMKAQFSRVGIAVAEGTYRGKPATFVVQFFATPIDSATSHVASPTPKISAENVPANELATSVPISSTESARASTSASVLGSETSSVPPTPTVTESSASFISDVGTFLAVATTSPTYMLWYIVGALLLVIAILLFLAIVVQIRVQYLEMIGGGILLLVVTISLFLFVGQNFSDVHVPTDMQSASVYVGFQGAQ